MMVEPDKREMIQQYLIHNGIQFQVSGDKNLKFLVHRDLISRVNMASSLNIRALSNHGTIKAAHGDL
jgi:hypothetical protein